MAKRSSQATSRKEEKNRKPKQSKRERCDDEKSPLLEIAEELADQLPIKYPHFVKLMLRSHVTKGFWLGLPAEFCRKHLGTKDQTIVLEDENGQKFKTTYLGGKTGLSGGWKGFSVHHKLNEGDVLVFQKVRLHEFKVYIVKPKGPKKVKRAPGNAEKHASTTSDLPQGFFFIDDYDENRKRMFDFVEPRVDSEYSDYFIEETGLSESAVTSVTCMEKFKVIFNYCCMNSQIPKTVLQKYYELCRSQNSYLHENVIKSLDNKLVAGLISESVNVADAIKCSKITMEESDFSTLDKTLKAAEMLGMNVGFMRSRASKLASLVAQSKVHKDARLAREQEEAEVRARLEDLMRIKEEEDKESSEKSAQLAASFEKVSTVPW